MAQGHERDLPGSTDLRVRGAIDKARDVTTAEVGETLVLGGQQGGIGDGLNRGSRALPGHVRLGAADPQPRVVLGRGRGVTVTPEDGLERRQFRRGHRRRGLAPGARAEHGHQVDTPRRHVRGAQPAERGDRLIGSDPRLQVELEEMMGVRALREDPELRKDEIHAPTLRR